MRRLLLLVLTLLCAFAPAAAMPPVVQDMLLQADDHPRQALDRIRLLAAAAQADGDDDARFWWALVAARVMARLELHGEAAQSAATAAALLDRWPRPTEGRRLWLQLSRLDAEAGIGDRATLLPAVTALRGRAEALPEPRLACEARALELWLLLNLRSDDEAWLAAEALETCGQALAWPEQVASAQLSFATLARHRLAEGAAGEQPQRHLALAQQALGERPARFLRSLLEWEAGIVLRHQKQPEAALERLRRAHALSRELQDGAGVAAANLEIAAVLLALDRPAEMLPLLEEAPRLLAAGGEGDLEFRMPRVMELHLLALVKLASPQLPAALDQARRWVQADGSAGGRARLQDAMAQALAATGRPLAAYEMLRASVQSEQQARSLARDTQVQRLQARYDSARRDAENAELRLRSEAARLQLQAETDRRQSLSFGLLALGALCVLGFSFGGRELARRQRMAALAMRDELTGQPNRRSVRAYAQEQLAQAQRLGLPFAVALVDFDHFKRVNDRHGHAAGDAVLRAFGQAAQVVLRGQDRLGRWGGEEWLLVMPGTRQAEIDAVFARLRERFAMTLIPGVPAEARCTFSMGAAELGPGTTDLEAMIEQADQALYRAKQEGRDRWVSAPLATAA
jgi:diguanylate cyclase (GGDEF)-like protein